MCEHGIEECPELTVCDGCLKDAKIKRAMDKKRDSEDIGNEEGSGIPSTTVTRPNFLEGWTMPDGAHCTSCHLFTTNRVVCTHCGAAQKVNISDRCIYHPETELVNGLCNKCQYGPRTERTCMGCRWHWSAPVGDGYAGTADHKCLAVDQSDGSWHFGALPMQGAKFIDRLNHTQYPPVPSWCPCIQIPVTEEQVEFAEHLPAIQCDGGHLDLMRQNVLLRSKVSQLELALDEIYCSVRRAKPAKECPTDCKAVLHDELYERNIELLNIAVRHHNDKVSALQEVQNLNDRNKQLEFECKRECERLEAIIAKGNAESVRLRNIIAESNIKPHVTGQGLPRKGVDR